MLGSDTRIIKSGGDRINGSDLAELILTEIGLHAVEDTESSGIDRGSRLEGIDASACGLASDESYVLVFNEVIEASDGIGTASAASYYRIGKSSLLLKDLCLDLLGDD